MIPLKHEEALKIIYSALKDSKIIWALTGSTSFILQGMDFNFNDIDIRTNKEGAYEIEKFLKDNENQNMIKLEEN